VRSRSLNSCAGRMIRPAWKYKYTKTKLKIRLCTRPLPVDREIGTRTQHNAAKKARAEDLYSPQEIVCSCTGFQFCTKLLISELSIILSSERGILRKAQQDFGLVLNRGPAKCNRNSNDRHLTKWDDGAPIRTEEKESVRTESGLPSSTWASAYG
jgi:hypothetical protein